MDAVVIYAIYVLYVSLRSSVIELYRFGKMDPLFGCGGGGASTLCVDACHGAEVLILQINGEALL